jgi:uncharacterized protein YcbX
MPTLVGLEKGGFRQMRIVGQAEGVWRYPVKSMRGEQLQEAFVGFPGVYGDRTYAFRSSAAPKAFPYLTGVSSQKCCGTARSTGMGSEW